MKFNNKKDAFKIVILAYQLHGAQKVSDQIGHFVIGSDLLGSTSQNLNIGSVEPIWFGPDLKKP